MRHFKRHRHPDTVYFAELATELGQSKQEKSCAALLCQAYGAKRRASYRARLEHRAKRTKACCPAARGRL